MCKMKKCRKCGKIQSAKLFYYNWSFKPVCINCYKWKIYGVCKNGRK